jgi:hypothetical protein
MKLPPFLRPRPDEDPFLEAIELRARYGEGAEEWCETGIMAAEQLERRRALYRIRDALRLVPAPDELHAV